MLGFRRRGGQRRQHHHHYPRSLRLLLGEILLSPRSAISQSGQRQTGGGGTYIKCWVFTASGTVRLSAHKYLEITEEPTRELTGSGVVQNAAGTPPGIFSPPAAL